MLVRKISIGADYKSNSMHYILNQTVLGGTATIHLIQVSDEGSVKIWVQHEDSTIKLWKEFNANMPCSIEYNIDKY
jgi:flagellar biogenesis protein FliO